MSVLFLRRESDGMKRKLFIGAVVLAVLMLAVGGWTVRGMRSAVAG